MQRPHRHQHRIVWLVLGPLALAAFLYAILNRTEMPVMEQEPDAPQTEPRGAAR